MLPEIQTVWIKSRHQIIVIQRFYIAQFSSEWQATLRLRQIYETSIASTYEAGNNFSFYPRDKSIVKTYRPRGLYIGTSGPRGAACFDSANDKIRTWCVYPAHLPIMF